MAAQPEIGSFGGGRFRILSRLGSGAMGVVFRVEDRDRGGEVALKLLRSVDPRGIFRFKQEFRALADVTHPNLVSLYELVASGEQWFFTMELVDGHGLLEHLRQETYRDELQTGPVDGPSTDTLSTLMSSTSGRRPARVRRKRRAPPMETNTEFARVRAAIAQLARGVHALHESGQLHRDVKPSNVMVAVGGRVVLLDFGVATALEAQRNVDGTQRIIGTPTYMAPEQGAGKPLTEASDWYAVGVILYEAVCGMRPFDGDIEDVLVVKQALDPPPLRERAPNVPPELEKLCLRMLARDPAERPSGAEILAGLEGGRAQPTSRARAVAAAPSDTVLIGRERELEVLRAAFAAVRDGDARTVLVSGSSGMGKSALVQHFIGEIEAVEGAVVLEGKCYERESVPYKALDSLIDSLTQHLLTLSRDDVWDLVPPDVPALARSFPVLRQVEAVLADGAAHLDSPDPHEQRRLRQLEPQARRLLEAVALAGLPLPQAIARTAAELPADERAALAQLRSAKLVRTRGDRQQDLVESFHDRIREAVVYSMQPERAKELHRRLALGLEGAGNTDPEVLAAHFEQAGQAERAAHYMARAAHNATEALAFERAATLYLRALDTHPVEGPEAAELYASLGAALARAGRGGDGAAAYLEAAARSSPGAALDHKRKAAEHLLHSGHFDEGSAVLGDVLSTMGISVPTTHRGALASLLLQRARVRIRGLRFKPRDASELTSEELAHLDACWSAAIGLDMFDLLRGNDFHTRHLLRALKSGERRHVARAMAAEATVSCITSGRVTRRSAKLIARAQQLAEELGDGAAIGWARGGEGLMAYMEGRWVEARQILERAEEVLLERCSGMTWELSCVQMYQLWALSRTGELGELARRVDGLLREARDRDDLYTITNVTTGWPNLAWLVRDEPARRRAGDLSGDDALLQASDERLRELGIAEPARMTRAFAPIGSPPNGAFG